MSHVFFVESYPTFRCLKPPFLQLSFANAVASLGLSASMTAEREPLGPAVLGMICSHTVITGAYRSHQWLAAIRPSLGKLTGVKPWSNVQCKTLKYCLAWLRQRPKKETCSTLPAEVCRWNLKSLSKSGISSTQTKELAPHPTNNC